MSQDSYSGRTLRSTDSIDRPLAYRRSVGGQARDRYAHNHAPQSNLGLSAIDTFDRSLFTWDPAHIRRPERSLSTARVTTFDPSWRVGFGDPPGAALPSSTQRGRLATGRRRPRWEVVGAERALRFRRLHVGVSEPITASFGNHSATEILGPWCRRRTPRGARGCDWHSVHASLRRTAVSRRCARKDEVCVVDGGALGSVDRGRVVHAQMARLDVLGRESLPVTGVSMFEVELLFRAGKDGPAVAVAHPLRIVRSVREAAGVGPGRSRDISQQEISATARCRRRAARSFGHTIDNEELTRPSRTNPGERSSGDCDVLTGARPARTTVHPIVSATRSTPYSVRPGAPMSRGDRPDAFTRA